MHRQVATIALLLAACLGASEASAQTANEAPANCTCLWQGPFVEAQAHADRVIRGTVTGRRGNAIDVAVQDVLRGKLYAKSVRIWGDYPAAPPASCRTPVESFEPGTEWVLALQQIHEVPPGGFDPDTPDLSFGRPGDFVLSRCGAFWLEVRDDFARGNLANDARWHYEDEKMEPVDVELIAAWLSGETPVAAVIAAGAPNPEARRLRRETLRFLRDQAPDPLDSETPATSPAAP